MHEKCVSPVCFDFFPNTFYCYTSSALYPLNGNNNRVDIFLNQRQRDWVEIEISKLSQKIQTRSYRVHEKISTYFRSLDERYCPKLNQYKCLTEVALNSSATWWLRWCRMYTSYRQEWRLKSQNNSREGTYHRSLNNTAPQTGIFCLLWKEYHRRFSSLSPFKRIGRIAQLINKPIGFWCNP